MLRTVSIHILPVLALLGLIAVFACNTDDDATNSEVPATTDTAAVMMPDVAGVPPAEPQAPAPAPATPGDSDGEPVVSGTTPEPQDLDGEVQIEEDLTSPDSEGEVVIPEPEVAAAMVPEPPAGPPPADNDEGDSSSPGGAGEMTPEPEVVATDPEPPATPRPPARPPRNPPSSPPPSSSGGAPPPMEDEENDNTMGPSDMPPMDQSPSDDDGSDPQPMEDEENDNAMEPSPMDDTGGDPPTMDDEENDETMEPAPMDDGGGDPTTMDDEGNDNTMEMPTSDDDEGDPPTMGDEENEDPTDQDPSTMPPDEEEEMDPPEPMPVRGNNVGNLAPAFTLPNALGGGNVSLSDYSGDPVVVVFYRSAFCTFCQRQIREINSNYGKFSERDIAVLAISSDNINSVTEQLIRNNPENYRFPLLYTSLSERVPAAYGRIGNVDDTGYNSRLGDSSADLADPGVFLIDGDGVIRWRDLGRNIGHFVSASTILSEADDLTS